MIAGVFLLILGPLVAGGILALLVYTVRRLEPLAALIAAGVSAMLGGLGMILPLDRAVQLGERKVVLGEPATLLGRQLVLKDVDRVILAFLFIISALLFIQAWRTRTGRSFYPLGLMVLGILSAALVVRPFLYAALMLNIAAALLTILIQNEQSIDTLGALRFLFMMTLAMLAFLIAGWQIGLYALNPTDSSLARTVTIALAIGFSLLLAIVPFHTWMASVARNAPPVAAVFLFTIFNAVCWVLLLDVLQEHPWLAQQPDFFVTLRTAGMLTAAIGGLLASASYDLGRVMAYGVLADWGCALLMLGLGTQAGLGALALGLFMRPVSLMLLALGLASARERTHSIELADWTGLAWNSPWTATALVLGAFSLAGIPPLPGFLSRWVQVRLLAGSYNTTAALLVLIVTVGIAAGALRALAMITPRPPAARADNPPPPESHWTRFLIAGGLVTSLIIVLFPGLFDITLRAIVASYTFLR